MAINTTLQTLKKRREEEGERFWREMVESLPRYKAWTKAHPHERPLLHSLVKVAEGFVEAEKANE